jgi:SAM-dependent methyltransferase
MPESVQERESREREAYADEAMTQANAVWQRRFSHIVNGPTAHRGLDTAYTLLAAKLGPGSRALDVGCGTGYYSHRLKQLGADYVLGYDISEHYVDKAQREYGIPGEVEFRVHSAHDPVDGTFDVVCGFAVLHHLDFRAFLLEAYDRNLKPGGTMLFWEPMSHPVILAFHKFVRSAHSDDEWPLMPRDVRWMRDNFAEVVVRPVNLAAMFTNAASSLLFADPDNPLSRLGDRIDRILERRRLLAPFGQMGIIVIEKPLNPTSRH